jgi:Tfp pilus assembly protein PilF
MARLPLALVSAVLLSSAPAVAQHHPPHGHAQPDRLGNVHFETSCNAEARQRFNRGAAWLHSFEYEEAERTFREAAAADPRCAMSHWGVAMSRYHPLWAPPSPADLAEGKTALDRAAAIGAGTQRERDYVAALRTFYGDTGKLDHRARTFAYEAAMEQLHRRYPDDREAAIFYGLALIASGMIDDDGKFGREIRAAGILNRVLAAEPEHPGVAHYLIHSYDYPPLAHLALAAARSYAGIAPASAHAQHMPSHIFTRLGLWDEAIRSNIAAEAAARAYAARAGLPGAWDEQLHAIDYLAYAYLQLGQDKEARRLIDTLNSIERVDPPNFKAAYTFSAVPARVALERRQWEEAAALALPSNALRALPWERFRWTQAHVHFARAVGAARGGNVEQARREVAALTEIRGGLDRPAGEYDWGTQVEIQRRIASAWLAAAEGRRDEALTVMRAAADLDDATEKHPVTPGAILPAREQLGEMLLEFGRGAQALVEFEASLRRAPRRFNSVAGAAKAARLAGKPAEAHRHYAVLRELGRGGNGTRPELADARTFLVSASAQ